MESPNFKLAPKPQSRLCRITHAQIRRSIAEISIDLSCSRCGRRGCNVKWWANRGTIRRRTAIRQSYPYIGWRINGTIKTLELRILISVGRVPVETRVAFTSRII